ncbi:MAG: metallophosphoesterase [Treponema sp.]|nr:MAG: metallophosphoesterase [Treponema sp.]
MNFIHIADLHCNKERKKYCLEALSIIKDFVKKTPSIILIAGDFWDSTITATENSGFVDFVKSVKELCELTDVIIITGTPSHEPAGSCDIFETFGAKVFKQNIFTLINSRYGKFELIAMPEPRKQDFVCFSDINKAIQQNYIDFINHIPERRDYPRIAVIHNEIRSAIFQNSITIDESHPTAIPVALLKKINADYYACGHIHEPQRIPGVGECYYSGSIYPRNFGETHNGGFYSISIESDGIKVKRETFGFPQNIIEKCDINDIEKNTKRQIFQIKM